MFTQTLTEELNIEFHFISFYFCKAWIGEKDDVDPLGRYWCWVDIALVGVVCEDQVSYECGGWGWEVGMPFLQMIVQLMPHNWLVWDNQKNATIFLSIMLIYIHTYHSSISQSRNPFAKGLLAILSWVIYKWDKTAQESKG